MEGIIYTGIPSSGELARCPGIPSQERMKKGRVAVIECVQEIPCNPCEAVCRSGAITVGEQITALPVLNGDKCTGCGLCVPGCPGLAIVIIDKSREDGLAVVEFPFEYLPLPVYGDKVTAVDRAGESVCEGEVLSVRREAAYGETAVVGLLVPLHFADEVRSMKRLPKETPEVQTDDVLICRCQEVSRRDILDAIADGATTLDGIKRRVRAGMGLCQGKTCERLVARILAEQTGQDLSAILPQKSRMPVRPVKINIFGGPESE